MRGILMMGMLAGAAAVAAPATPATPQANAPLEVSVLRFLRADGSTIVEGMVRVPFDAVTRLRGDATSGFGAYRLHMVVRDTAGLILTERAWAESLPSRLLQADGGSAVELFRLGVAPGGYAVEVVLTDSASGRVSRAQTGFSGYATAPLVSDLVLSPAIRAPAGPEDTAALGGEIRRGGVFITLQPVPVLTPASSNLYYYVELYREDATTATLQARVLGPEGEDIAAGPPMDITVAAGGGTAASGVPLAGLPQGAYTLELVVAYPDTTVARRAPFRMAGTETARQARAMAVAAGGTADYFARASEAVLDTLYAPLLFIQEDDERGVYESLSLEGKRNYLRRFWARRGPEMQRAYYNAVATANREFAESGAAAVPGWRTDRGRIFLRHGPPEDVLRRPQAGSTMPYEVWKYSRGRARRYVFLDRTGFGNYQLIYTNDRNEPSMAGWEAIMGPEVVEEILRF